MTHQQLAKAVGVSPAMVNNYLSRFLESAYVERHGSFGRNVRYQLSKKGRNYRDRLLIDYNAELIRMHGTAIEGVSNRVMILFGGKETRIAVCPAGDTTAVLLNVLPSFPEIRLKGILDDCSVKQVSGFLGNVVLPFETLSRIDCDGVLISTIAFADRMERRVKENRRPDQTIWRLF